MSVQRYSAYHSGDPSQIGLWPDPGGYWLPYVDHARVVAEMEQAHAEALAAEVQTHLDALDILRAEHAAALLTQDQQHMAALADMYELGKADGFLLGEEKAHRDSVIVHEGAAELRGYKRGLAAKPRTLTAAERAAIGKVLLDNGFDSDSTMHRSWRCFDKVRYPEPCDCLMEVVGEIAAALIHDSDKEASE